ncbi:Glutathione transferase family protein [Pleurotus pulmonarius]
MSKPQITLYNTQASPYGHYVEIALREAKTEHTVYEVDLGNKPSWFVEKVNPVGKVPAISYGGPAVPPDVPSPASFKLAESLVILEFLIDLFPEANLLPLDPVERASTRFLVNLFAEKLRTAYISVMVNRASTQVFVAAVEELQKYMPTPGDKQGPYIRGDTFTSIDAVAAGFLLRLDGCLKRDIGSFPEGEGIQAYDVLHTSERFEKYRAYLSTLRQRDSVSGTYPEEEIVAVQRAVYLPLRAPA